MLEKMKEIIAEQLGVEEDEITPDTSFKEDLGADSLDLFELTMALEEEYDTEIPAEELEDIETVGDVIEYLREKGIDTEYGRTLTADPNMKAVFVGRDVKSWSAPIEEGPFYAVKLVPVTYHTMGGPKKSVKAEVLDPFGEPIPRLYVPKSRLKVTSEFYGLTFS
mgnify:CR=1 FL=1